MTDTAALVGLAREAAASGADVLSRAFSAIRDGSEKLSVRQKTSPIDLVTDIDGRAQETIIAVIQSRFPDHRFLAEEEGADALGDPKCPYRWIIDPLDGTTNFIHGKEIFGSIVAVEKDGKLLAGAMNLPLLRHEYWGGKGTGAFFNGNPVKLRATRNLNDALLSCNLRHRAKEQDGTLIVTVPPCGWIENCGCAAEELGAVLRGNNDGVFFDGVRIWDVATGFLMMEEAGGKVRYRFKDPDDHRSGLICAASTAPIFEELWEWVEEKM